MRFRRFAPFAWVLVLVTAVSCARGTEQGSDATTAGTEAAVSVSAIEVGKDVGVDKRITEQTRTFAPDETIYASVITNGAAPSAEIRTRWTFEDGQVVDETVQTIAPNGHAATEFHISRSGGLPPGTYKVEVFLNGTPAGTEEFEVRAAS
jgi:hypothetical protein